ncbi:kinase-like protein [Gloeophyllum trabeum ATCC 11539]|uniref:Kinase-like protein n=1 Tax=Gloeophyllum trabeum (strain ATCC 11539 / FP-39264 / Madison 617) TaxID=670483 RepID=S7QNM0_GLOTA|nr:kinase-like protein [Gloeophyllum trabeum ATCC 11539]EPQ61146.1 kinase-like protein [Gloeophyllum trabeum ATCC 11539]
MAELLDEVLTKVKPKHDSRVITCSLTDRWTDEEVRQQFKVAPRCPGGDGVEMLSDDTVVKYHPTMEVASQEARALQFVWAHTSIPVPQVRRVVGTPRGALLLMEYIKGQTLDRLWPSLSSCQRFIVSWTLRGYIQQLRAASTAYPRRHIPGPMSDTPQVCEGSFWIFDCERPKGPFTTWAEFCEELNEEGPESLKGRRFDTSEELFLTHFDLSARNVIMGEDGRIWLIDFGRSGFYPVWFEYISMMSAAEGDEAPTSWWKHIPLVTGCYAREQNMLGWQAFNGLKYKDRKEWRERR